MSVSKEVEKQVLKKKKGEIIFISDFSGNYDAIRKSLQRLTNNQVLIRLSKGIYYYPKTDIEFGILYPNANQIAQAIAKRDKARIIPTGIYAIYLIGLTTQIPMNVVFLTDGSARTVKIGKQKIIFKKTSPKNLNVQNQLCNIVIQALRTIGQSNLSDKDIQKIKDVIAKSGEQDALLKNCRNAPIWIQKTIVNIVKSIENE
jgi:hypothetical protein